MAHYDCNHCRENGCCGNCKEGKAFYDSKRESPKNNPFVRIGVGAFNGLRNNDMTADKTDEELARLLYDVLKDPKKCDWMVNVSKPFDDIPIKYIRAMANYVKELRK